MNDLNIGALGNQNFGRNKQDDNSMRSFDTGRDGPMAQLPNLGSNAGVLMRRDVIAAKDHSKSRSPDRQRDTNLSMGSSLNPNLKKAKEDRLKYQKRFLNGEEASGSDQEDEESKEWPLDAGPAIGAEDTAHTVVSDVSASG